MNAYVFAQSATTQAVSDLIADVGTNGVRVVCPLGGDRAIYVAITADNENDLDTRISAVVGTSGLTGTSSHIALSGDPNEQVGFPTHYTVSSWVGFAHVTPVSSASTLAGAAAALSGVIGVAVVTGNKVLVEVTATTQAGVQSLLAGVTALSGVSSTIFTAYGEAAEGAGF